MFGHAYFLLGKKIVPISSPSNIFFNTSLVYPEVTIDVVPDFAATLTASIFVVKPPVPNLLLELEP